MKVLILGGSGLQGRAAIYDLSRTRDVEEIVCADINPDAILSLQKFVDLKKIKLQKVDVRERETLVALLKDGVDVVIDMLPVAFIGAVAEAAIEAGVSLVNTMYAHQMPRGLDEKARDAGVTLMPESGIDPGIDLVLCGFAVSQLDEVLELHSSCGGFPEEKAIDNPLKYKISWTWNGVLLSYKRPARIIKDGRIISIPPKDQFAEQWIGVVDFPGLGKLELIPNGDAVVFAEHLGIAGTLRNTSRFSMRWPGHSEFWRKLVALKFLSDEPIEGLPFELTPHEFMVKHLEPQLQYKEGERDVVAMRNTIVGTKGGVRKKMTYDMLDMRDLETGLFAMNRGVGYTASIVAQMIANGEIKRKGLLTPVKDIPYMKFLNEIKKRGIVIRETVETEGRVD